MQTFNPKEILSSYQQIHDDKNMTGLYEVEVVECQRAFAANMSLISYLNDGPLELYLTTYNYATKAVNEPITLEVRELVGGREIFAHTITDPVAPGRSERKLSLGFPFIGEFRARLIKGDGEQINPEDYIFVNYPVFEETYQGVMYTLHSAATKCRPSVACCRGPTIAIGMLKRRRL